MKVWLLLLLSLLAAPSALSADADPHRPIRGVLQVCSACPARRWPELRRFIKEAVQGADYGSALSLEYARSDKVVLVVYGAYDYVLGRYTVTDQPQEKLHQLVQDLGFSRVSRTAGAGAGAGSLSSSKPAGTALPGFGSYVPFGAASGSGSSTYAYTPFASDVTGPFTTYSSLNSGYGLDLSGAAAAAGSMQAPAVNPVLAPGAVGAVGVLGVATPVTGAAVGAVNPANPAAAAVVPGAAPAAAGLAAAATPAVAAATPAAAAAGGGSLGGLGGAGSGFGAMGGLGGMGGGLGGGGLGSFASFLGDGNSFVGSKSSAFSSSESEESRPYPISFGGFGRHRRRRQQL